MNPASAPADRLAALRGAGAWRVDPVRFHALEALARRMEGQADAVRALLRARLDAAIADYEQRVARAPAARPAAAAAQRAPAGTALAALTLALRDAARARAAAAAPGEAAPEHELASARRFRQAWQASRTLDQVSQALQRRPANAGPLNSHALVLQSLARMRELSPAYLGRFLEVVETLQWLEQSAIAPRSPAPPRPARARRRGRAGES